MNQTDKCPKGEFYEFLKTKLRLSNSACTCHNCVIYRMMASGLTEEDLLTGDYIKLVDDWLVKNNPLIIKGDSKRRYRSAIRKFREFRGVEW